MKAGLALGITVWLAATAPRAGLTQESPQSEIQRHPVHVEYVAPKDPKHQQLYELLKGRGVLEKLQQLLSPFLWPRTLTLRLEGCDGEVDAWYENATVTVCY